MLNSRVVLSCLATAVAAAACGQSVTVLVEDETEPVADLPVEILPYDRDSVFAVLTREAATPEPQIPADVQASYDSVQVLQAQWREQETNWNNARDSLRVISERMQGLDPRAPEYRELFDRFGQLESRERTLNRQRSSSFNSFTALQQATQERLDSVRAVIQQWEDVTFADFGTLEEEILEAEGRSVVYDTTGVDGTFSASLSGGPWWVHARIPTADGEIYWNVPADLSADTIRLTPANGEVRQRY